MVIKRLAAESVTVNLILNRAEPDDPEGYLLASMTDIGATEEKYADKLQGKTVNEYFLAQDEVTQRVVDGLAEGKIIDVHIQDTTPRSCSMTRGGNIAYWPIGMRMLRRIRRI
jgi:hypothetical protein